jgi:hypothetical protein
MKVIKQFLDANDLFFIFLFFQRLSNLLNSPNSPAKIVLSDDHVDEVVGEVVGEFVAVIGPIDCQLIAVADCLTQIVPRT